MTNHVAYITHGNILDKRGIHIAALFDLLKGGIGEILERGVLEAALLGLGERGADGEGDDNVVGVLGCDVAQSGAWGQVLEDGTETFDGHCDCCCACLFVLVVKGLVVRLSGGGSWNRQRQGDDRR